jgi:hypothetical protein
MITPILIFMARVMGREKSFAGSVAFYEWKAKSLRIFLEERYGTDRK